MAALSLSVRPRVVVIGAGFGGLAAIKVWPVATGTTTLAVILGLALVRLVVQFRCFLHISFSRSSRDDLLLTILAAIIVALMVSGTLVILFNLRDRMM